MAETIAPTGAPCAPARIDSADAEIAYLPDLASDTGASPGWLPAAPLSVFIDYAGGISAVLRARGFIGAEEERLAKAYHRGQSRGLYTLYRADELAVRALGMHPMQVWGDGWLVALTHPRDLAA